MQSSKAVNVRQYYTSHCRPEALLMNKTQQPSLGTGPAESFHVLGRQDVKSSMQRLGLMKIIQIPVINLSIKWMHFWLCCIKITQIRQVVGFLVR